MSATAIGRELFARDFDALAPEDRFGSRARTITETDVVAFSWLTGDWHPQHADAVWSSTSRFGERIAHGMLVLSCALGLVALDPDRVLALRRIAGASFREPVRIGDTIHVEGSVRGTRPLDAASGLVELEWRVLNQHGRVVARLTTELLWRRGTEPGGGRSGE